MSLTIQITQQFVRIGMQSAPSQLEIKQPIADQQISTHNTQLTIDQGPGVLTIDTEESRSALGHKPTSRLVSDVAAQVRQMVLQTIGNISTIGHELSDLAHGVTVAGVIKQEVTARRQSVEFVGPFSANSVQVNYQPHPTTLDWTPPQVDVQTTPQPPQIQYTPGQVSVYLEQRNGLSFQVKGQYMNQTF